MTEQEQYDLRAQEEILSRIDNLHRIQVRRRMGFVFGSTATLALIAIILLPKLNGSVTNAPLLAEVQSNSVAVQSKSVTVQHPVTQLSIKSERSILVEDHHSEEVVEDLVPMLEIESADLLAERLVLEQGSDTDESLPILVENEEQQPLLADRNQNQNCLDYAEEAERPRPEPRQFVAKRRSRLRDLFNQPSPEPNMDGTNLQVNITNIFQS